MTAQTVQGSQVAGKTSRSRGDSHCLKEADRSMVYSNIARQLHREGVWIPDVLAAVLLFPCHVFPNVALIKETPYKGDPS